MHRTPEAKVKDEVKKLFKKYGIVYLMHVPGTYNISGWPDFTCCIRGKFLAVECKAKDGMKPTALQAVKLEEIRQAGGITMVVTPQYLKDLEHVLKEMSNDPEI